MDAKCSSRNPIRSEAKSSAPGSNFQGTMPRGGGPTVGVYSHLSELAPGHFSPQCVHFSISGKMFASPSIVFPPFLLLCLLFVPTSPSPPPCRPSPPGQQCQFGEYEDPRCGRLCYKVLQIITRGAGDGLMKAFSGTGQRLRR